MVAGVWMHFKSLRKMKVGYGEQIREMLAEAENERMHLMFFIEIAKPNYFERFIVLFSQMIFGLFYLHVGCQVDATFFGKNDAWTQSWCSRGPFWCQRSTRYPVLGATGRGGTQIWTPRTDGVSHF